MRDLDLSAVLAETFVLMASHMISQKVILRQQIQPDLPMVHGNGALLQQVFTNLILNACNAMPQGGSLTVTACATDAGRVELQFADTGCGIPQEHLNKIFDPFFATMRAGKGAGLGLSISYSIIQQHRGDIRVESQVGVGTTFIISLPALA
jgi:signal transduction histidine kinase